MSGQNRLLAILLGVLAVLVLLVGGLSAVLLVGGGSDDGSPSGVRSGTSDGGGSGDGGDGSSSATGRLRLSGTDPVTLDPHLATDASSAEYIVEIFSGLVTITPDLEIALDLAEALDVSADGTVYTFTLRDDAFFHSGRRVTAEDVAYSINRATSRELQSPVARAYLGDIVGAREHLAGQADSVSGVEVIDDWTIRFTLDAPKPFFLAKLTYPTAFVVDQQQIESNPRNWTRNPNGTGPYRLQEWRLGERIVLESNARFYLGEPPLKEVLYALSGGSALTRFENDDLDVASISINDVDRARDPSSDLNPLYAVWPQFTISYLAFNTAKPPFDDVNVRRAFGLSIDRAKIAAVTFNSMIAPATGILAPGLPGYTADDKTLPFDPDAARAALADSKYTIQDGRLVGPDGPLTIVITEVGAGAEAAIDTQAFLEQWRTELGLDVEIRQTDFATYLAEQDAGELQMFNGGWIMDYPDPEDILDLKFHSGSQLNDLSYANPQVDAFLEAARTEQDPELRLQQYRDAEQLIIDDAAWLPLYFSQAHVVVNPAVTGWFEPQMVIPRLRFVEVNR
ncbi:MAG: peptide ABC transporter substrate-binding protein [Chloroflexi bacterium]|nr:peptide ABC transporter substrate-binding protein [Chloroflexota bacterium]